MARLRVIKANKGKVIDFIRSQKKEERLYGITKKIIKQTQKSLNAKTNEKIGNIEVIKNGK